MLTENIKINETTKDNIELVNKLSHFNIKFTDGIIFFYVVDVILLK